MSQIIDQQPAIVRQLLEHATKQSTNNGTECYWSALKISDHQLNLLKAEASLLIPQISHYAKGGDGFEWSAKVIFQHDGSVICSFVFNEYKD